MLQRATCRMSFNKDIAIIRARLIKAQSDRDTWRLTGSREKYLESCSLVDAMELELDRLRKLGLRSLAR